MRYSTIIVVLAGILTTIPAVAEEFPVGKEFSVKSLYAGPADRCAVYLPPDYTKEKLWPTVICYHGRGGGPTTLPYRNFVESKNFVLIGTDYYWNSMDTNSKIDEDVANAKKLFGKMMDKFSLHPNYVFLAGNSAGGFLVSGIMEENPSLWAGLMILGAGRYEHLHERPSVPGLSAKNLFGGFHIAAPNSPKRNGFQRMPIYIGAGESDPNHWWAEKAASYYQQKGAAVIFETYPGGHGSYPKTKTISRFFEEFGPLREARSNLDQAKKNQEKGDLGIAYEKFKNASSIPGDYDLTKEAGKSADELKKQAEDLFSEAEKASQEERYQDAIKALKKVSSLFRGSEEIEQRASRALVPLLRSPEKQKIIARAKLNDRANYLEKEGRQAEGKKDYLKAFKIYEHYLIRFQEADRYPIVQKHYFSLKTDPVVGSILEVQKKERDCQNWFNMAKNFLRAGKEERARKYLEKIIQENDSLWAEKARTILERIS